MNQNFKTFVILFVFFAFSVSLKASIDPKAGSSKQKNQNLINLHLSSDSEILLTGLSHATFTGTSYGTTVSFTDPHTGSPRSVFAGLVIGIVDGHPTVFFCTDLAHNLPMNVLCHVDSAGADGHIIYIVTHTGPYDSVGVGKLPDSNREAAAIQIACWSYSDGLNINTVAEIDIRDRALQIRADADANGSGDVLAITMKIKSSNDPNKFYIETVDQNNVPVAIDSIELQLVDGELSTYMVSTGISGKSEDVTVIDEGGRQIIATAMAVIPQGMIYICEDGQRMVVAYPTRGIIRVSVDWGALPVELSSFTSSINGSNVQLNWTTASEINNAGFDIERASVDNEWRLIGVVTGRGSTNLSTTYSFTDNQLISGRYQYRLKQRDFNGNFDYYSLEGEVIIGIPQKYSLSQNYPNPFNPTTTIDYDILKDGIVSLKIFDISGKEIATLVNNEHKTAGYYSVNFNAAGLSSGAYFYRIQVGGIQQTKKMTIIK